MSISTEAARIPDELVKIKLSLCQKCNGIVRAAVEHAMTTKSKNSFLKEVMKYDLAVKTIPLLEYREGKIQWCNCNNETKTSQHEK